MTSKAKQITLKLEKKFGIPQRNEIMDPLSNLVLTVLSQSTNDKNRDTAYVRLKERYPTWEKVMNGDVKIIAEAIRPGGLANQKSERIQDILKWIHKEYGTLNLDCLCEMDPDQTIKKFTQLKGVGVKTISVVMMFSCGIDIFPVDTHVHRISNLIPLVHTKTPDDTELRLVEIIPQQYWKEINEHFVRLGQTICKPQKQECAICPLNQLCARGQERMAPTGQ